MLEVEFRDQYKRPNGKANPECQNVRTSILRFSHFKEILRKGVGFFGISTKCRMYVYFEIRPLFKKFFEKRMFFGISTKSRMVKPKSECKNVGTFFLGPGHFLENIQFFQERYKRPIATMQFYVYFRIRPLFLRNCFKVVFFGISMPNRVL